MHITFSLKRNIFQIHHKFSRKKKFILKYLKYLNSAAAPLDGGRRALYKEPESSRVFFLYRQERPTPEPDRQRISRTRGGARKS